MKKILFLFLFALMSSSCEEPKQLKVTLVYDKPLEGENYPSYIQDIVMPFHVNDCESTNEILLKPINVVRADIKRSGKEVNAWYFESIGELSVDFSKDWLKYYFTDSLVDPYLLQKTKNRKLKLANYLKEGENSFIYHENSENEEYKGYPIYADGGSLNKAIQAVACDETITEIYVLINPTELASVKKPIEETEIVPGKGDEETTMIKGDPCSQNTLADALALKKDLLKIVNTSLSYSERDKIARQTWDNYFDPMASITMYLDLTEEHPDFWESGDGKNYLVDRLAFKNSIRDISIIRLEYHKETKKITSMITVECHDASQIQ